MNGSLDIQETNTTSFNSITVSGVMDFDTAGTYTLTNSIVNEVTNSSGGTVIINVSNTIITTNTGPNITIVVPAQPISITNIVAGSRLRIYNSTSGAETLNIVVTGTSYISTYVEGGDYSDGDLVDIYLEKPDKDEWSTTVVDTSNGFNVRASQINDLIYNLFNIDGSTVVKFAADYVQNDVDLVIGGNWTMKELYAWWKYNLSTEQGIRNFFGGITAIDEANFRVNTAIVNLFLDNLNNASYIQTDNRRFFRDTADPYPVRRPTTSGYGLDAVWRNTVLIADIDNVAAIKAKTDLLNFTGTDVKATLDGEEVVTDTASRDASKANVSTLATKAELASVVANLSTFNPASDTVARVTLVDTTTDLTNAPSGGTTPAAIYTYFTDGTREDVFKADLSTVEVDLGDINTSLQQRNVTIIEQPSKRNYGQSGF